MIPTAEIPNLATLEFIENSKTQLRKFEKLERVASPETLFIKLYKVVFSELYRQQSKEIRSCYNRLFFKVGPPTVTYGMRFLNRIELLTIEHHGKNAGFSIKLGSNAVKLESRLEPILQLTADTFEILKQEKKDTILEEKQFLVHGATGNENFDLDAPTPSELRKLNLSVPKKQRAVREIKEFFGLNEVSEDDLRDYLTDCADLKIKIVSMCSKSDIEFLLNKLSQIEAKGLQFAKAKNGD